MLGTKSGIEPGILVCRHCSGQYVNMILIPLSRQLLSFQCDYGKFLIRKFSHNNFHFINSKQCIHSLQVTLLNVLTLNVFVLTCVTNLRTK